MPPTPPRRLNLIDGMIALAGLAGCFVLTRLYLDAYWPTFIRSVAMFTTSEFTVDWCIGEVAKVSSLWLALLSPILLLIRLRRPRPNRIEIFAQPGALATVTSTVITAGGMMLWVGSAAVAGQRPGLFFYRLTFSLLLAHTGSAIAVVWFVAALAGRWTAEPGAIDRAGRLLGLGWIVVFLMLTCSQFHERVLVDQLPQNGQYYLQSNKEAIRQ